MTASDTDDAERAGEGALSGAHADEEAPSRAIDGTGASERAKLVGRAGVVAAGTLASRVLGLARDVALAAVFTRAQTDAFFVAFRLPNLFRQLLGEGAVSSAVVPVLSEKLANEGPAAGRAFFARARGVSLVALAVVTVLGMIFARPLCEAFATGYHARPGEFERTVGLTRAVFPYIFFMGTAALGMAALNAERRFAVAAFAPGLLNVAFLASAFGLPALLAARGVDPTYALAIGALVGGALQVVAQWPALRRLGYLTRPRFDLADPGVRKMLARIAPMTFGIGVYFIDLMLSARFLSELGEGAQSYFAFAQRLCDFPQGIFVMAISTAALPSLARLAAKGDVDEMGKTYAHGMSLALFVAIPASVGLVVLGGPIVGALFGHGEFGPIAVEQTRRALVWQGAAIWTVTAVRQMIPVFHALGDTRTPVVVSAIDLVSFIVLAVVLRGPMGHVGISVAVGGSSAVQMVLLAVGLKRRIGTLRAAEIGASAARTLVASGAGALGGWGIARLLTPSPAIVAASAVARVVPASVGVLVFVALFVLAAWGVGSTELAHLLAAIRRRRRARAAT